MGLWFDATIIELAALAARAGARRLAFDGRRGWVRPAGRLGFVLKETFRSSGRVGVRMERTIGGAAASSSGAPPIGQAGSTTTPNSELA